uniref:Uncharacterized protein n=1 Tax=Knipowitschia caucasica TaxID=637954 RepID=A0AAV2MG37_KNICA
MKSDRLRARVTDTQGKRESYRVVNAGRSGPLPSKVEPLSASPRERACVRRERAAWVRRAGSARRSGEEEKSRSGEVERGSRARSVEAALRGRQVTRAPPSPADGAEMICQLLQLVSLPHFGFYRRSSLTRALRGLSRTRIHTPVHAEELGRAPYDKATLIQDKQGRRKRRLVQSVIPNNQYKH